MSSHFLSVLRQAFKTFDRANQSAFSTNLMQLKHLTDQLTHQDLHIDSQTFLNDHLDRAPCTFVHIFENDYVSLSVFVMRSGFTMPLHDHPMMHGLLRGIFGQLRIQSYTKFTDTNERFVQNQTSREICVRAEDPKLVSPETDTAILTPIERNFHEITAVDGTAAFFDILSPPYDVFLPEYGIRKCSFYRPIPLKLSSHGELLLQLERIPTPSNYYCDTAETPEAVLESIYTAKESCSV